MATNDNTALLLQVSADTSKAEKRLEAFVNKLNGIDKRVSAAGVKSQTSLDRFFGKGVTRSFDDITGSALRGAGPLNNFAGGLGTVGAAGAALTVVLAGTAFAIKGALEDLDFGDKLQASADKLKISAEALQELQYAADETDVPLEALQENLQALNANLGAFKSGVGDARVKAVFEALHLKREDLAGIDDANAFLPILADRIREVGTVAEQAQFAKKLGVAEMLPLLREGSAGIAQMRDRARELGLVLSNETVKGLSDAQREMELASQQIKANLRVAFADLAVDIAGATTKLAEFMGWIRRLGDEHPRLAMIVDDLRKMAANPYFGPLGQMLDTYGKIKAARAAPLPGAIGSPQGEAARLAMGNNARTAWDAAAARLPPPKTTVDGRGGRAPKGTKADPITVETVRQLGSATFDGFDPIKARYEAFRQRQSDSMRPVDGMDMGGFEPFKPFGDDFQQAAEKAADLAEEARKQWADSVSGGINEGLHAVADGNFGEFLKMRLREAIFEAAAEGLTAGLARGIASSGGGFWGSVLNGVASIFGGARAGGGSVAGGRAYLVGERGPEIFAPGVSGSIIPNGAIKQVAGMGGSQSVTVVSPVYIDATGSVGFEEYTAGINNQIQQSHTRAVATAVQIASRGMPGRALQASRLGS